MAKVAFGIEHNGNNALVVVRDGPKELSRHRFRAPGGGFKIDLEPGDYRVDCTLTGRKGEQYHLTAVQADAEILSTKGVIPADEPDIAKTAKLVVS